MEGRQENTPKLALFTPLQSPGPSSTTASAFTGGSYNTSVTTLQSATFNSTYAMATASGGRRQGNGSNNPG